jgi:hypothetical protein
MHERHQSTSSNRAPFHFRDLYLHKVLGRLK